MFTENDKCATGNVTRHIIDEVEGLSYPQDSIKS